MKIIEKIEINDFRSFSWTKKWEKSEIINIKDLNIFSGSNDSWKSNILRALNLFFNDTISIKEKFDFFKDFPFSKNEEYRKVISIKIYFNLSWFDKRDKFLPEVFSITKFYSQFSNDYRDYLLEWKNKKWEDIKIFSNPDKNKNKTSEKQYRQHLIWFLNNISFEYVPAIKDQDFYTNLFWRIILSLKNNEDKKIDGLNEKIKYYKNKDNSSIKKITNLINVRKKKIKEETFPQKNKIWKKEIENFNIDLANLNDENFSLKEIDKLSKELKEISILNNALDSLKNWINNYSKQFLFEVSSFLPSEFMVSQDFESFFQKFDLWTWNEKSISLRLRWDWMQAKFIPEFLKFLNNYDDKNFYIWWFEEPENSSEYINQQNLAKKLKEEFSIDKQIFLTTHSEEFLSLYDDITVEFSKRNSSLYHVKKIKNINLNELSIVKYFDVDENIFVWLDTKWELENDLWTSLIRAKYSKELKKIEDDYLNKISWYKEKNKNTLFVEWNLEKKLFEKIIDNNLFNIEWSKSANWVSDNIIWLSFIEKKFKYLWLFDKDKAWKEAVKLIGEKKKTNSNVKNIYLEANNELILILKKLKINYSLDELMPDFVWKYLEENDFLEEDNKKFDLSLIPSDKSKKEFLEIKFTKKIDILKVSKKIKTIKKEDYLKYILLLEGDNFKKIKECLLPTIRNIKTFFNDNSK